MPTYKHTTALRHTFRLCMLQLKPLKICICIRLSQKNLNIPCEIKKFCIQGTDLERSVCMAAIYHTIAVRCRWFRQTSKFLWRNGDMHNFSLIFQKVTNFVTNLVKPCWGYNKKNKSNDLETTKLCHCNTSLGIYIQVYLYLYCTKIHTYVYQRTWARRHCYNYFSPLKNYYFLFYNIIY